MDPRQATLNHKIRSMAFDAVLAAWTALFAPLIPIFMLTSTPKQIRGVTRVWVGGVFVLLRQIVGLAHVVRGRENRPDGPCLIVCNHQSTWETLAMLVLFPDVTIIAKQELLNVPIFGWYLRRSPMITIDREVGMQALRTMVEGAKAALADGRSVLIFPEGTRKSPDEPIEFKRGTEMLYAKLDVPVLPVVINSGRFWQRGRAPKRPGTITVSYLPPIAPGLKGGEMLLAAAQTMEAERLRIG